MDSPTFVKCVAELSGVDKEIAERVRDLRRLAGRRADRDLLPDSGEPLSIAVRGQRPDDERLLFHCLVPAARWWDDIVFT